MGNIYVDFNSWGFNESNGNGGFVPRKNCDVTIDDVKEVVNELIENKTDTVNIEEKDDKLYVNGKEVMTDDYVKSGVYNGDGTATLQIGEDKTATIENLPQPMTPEEVREMFNKE